MEGKTVILSVFMMTVVMVQNQVEAKSCCPATTARHAFNMCSMTGASEQTCEKISGCIIVSGTTCPSGYPYGIFENSGYTVNEYCKLGCTSSVCGGLTILQNSDSSEIVNGAVAQCTNACSNFCTKGSANAVETA